MQDYRVYIVGADGHIMGFVGFWCSDDDAAKAQAGRRGIGWLGLGPVDGADATVVVEPARPWSRQLVSFESLHS